MLFLTIKQFGQVHMETAPLDVLWSAVLQKQKKLRTILHKQNSGLLVYEKHRDKTDPKQLDRRVLNTNTIWV